MTVLPNKLIIQTIFKTHSHHCKTKSAGDYMVDTYISMKLTLLSDLFFSLSFSTSGTVSIGTVLSMLFVRYLVLLHPSSNIRLLLKPNLYLQWFTLQTNQNEFSIDWWLTHNKGGYILWPSKSGLCNHGGFLVESVSKNRAEINSNCLWNNIDWKFHWWSHFKETFAVWEFHWKSSTFLKLIFWPRNGNIGQF